MKWYKSLTINQKINLKAMCHIICGMKWEDFNLLFTPQERIELIYNKMALEFNI